MDLVGWTIGAMVSCIDHRTAFGHGMPHPGALCWTMITLLGTLAMVHETRQKLLADGRVPSCKSFCTAAAACGGRKFRARVEVALASSSVTVVTDDSPSHEAAMIFVDAITRGSYHPDNPLPNPPAHAHTHADAEGGHPVCGHVKYLHCGSRDADIVDFVERAASTATWGEVVM
jgi:hypothetical protein